MKNEVIKPVASALWLIENTMLTFEQIAGFCNLSLNEVKELADGFEKADLEPSNPIQKGQLTEEEIKRCERNSSLKLRISELPIYGDINIKKSKRVFTPMSQRKDKISAAVFLFQNHPLTISQGVKLTKAKKKTVEDIFAKTYTKIDEITPKDPVSCGLCTSAALNEELAKIKKHDRN